MAKLKNDALRARHWRLLMEKTAHSFDMDSGRFEVGHMFAMSLYKHQVNAKVFGTAHTHKYFVIESTNSTDHC